MAQWVFKNSFEKIIILKADNIAYKDETLFHNVTITEDGTNLILSATNDPNIHDKLYDYTDIVTPSSGSLTELVEILNGWKNQAITSHNISYLANVLKLGETEVQTPTDGILQNIGGDLYWNGTSLTGGGGGGIVQMSSHRINNTVNQTGLLAGDFLSWNLIVDDLGTGNVTINGGDPTIIDLDAGWYYIISIGVEASFTAAGGSLVLTPNVLPQVAPGVTETGKSLRIRPMNSASLSNTIGSSTFYQDCTSTARTFRLGVSIVSNLNAILSGFPSYPYMNVVGFKTV